jgi:hypothetical protein
VRWYVARDQKVVGPLSFDALLDAARQGRLKRTDHVWQSGTENWERADSLPALWDSAPRLRWRLLGIVLLAVAIGAVVASRMSGKGVSELAGEWRSIMNSRIAAENAARPPKKDCAFGEFIEGKCR